MAENAKVLVCGDKELGKRENSFLKSVFKKYDKNDTGAVGEEELADCLQEDIAISLPEVQAVIKRFDEDSDGVLSFKEFTDMVWEQKDLFYKQIHRYVNLFVVPNEGIVSKRRSSLTGLYEDMTKMKKSTVGMIILSIVQFILYFTNWKDSLIFDHNRRLQVWRYASYVFAHNSIFHLLINVTVQLLVGLPLEMVNSWRILVIYFAGILGGCLTQSVIYPLEDLAGASPAVYAIITAHISKILLNFREINNPVPQLIIFGIFTALDSIYNYFTFWNNERVSYISHLGGSAFGFLMGIIILKNFRKKVCEIHIWRASLILYVASMVALVSLELIRIIKDHHK